MAYSTTVTTPEKQLKQVPIELIIQKDEKRLGRVRLYGNRIEYFPPNVSKKGFKKSWVDFAALMSK